MHSEQRIGSGHPVRVPGNRASRVLVALAAMLLSACYDGDPSGFRESVVVNREGVTALAITGELPVIETGSALQLAAMATVTGGSKNLAHSVTWSSSNADVLRVSSRGQVTAVANGTAQISAGLAQFSDSVTIVASDAALQSVSVTGSASVDECATATYTASGHYDDGTDRDITSLVTWALSDTTVARMSTLSGEANLLVSKQAGTTGLTAARSSIVSTPLTVTVNDTLTALVVTPAAPAQIPIDGSQQFTATGTWGATTANISRAALWTIVNETTGGDPVATVINGDVSAGLVSGANAGGSGTLTAACGGQSDDTAITVVHLDTLAITNARPIELAPGASMTLVLEGTYSDSSTRPLNESAAWTVATVSGTAVTVSNTAGTRGRITAASAEGVSTVTATVAGKSVSVSVSVVR
jgi:hypothetical protein